jgi:acyltransferase
MSTRVAWVDYAKAINIFLVILGHTALPYEYRSIIYAFHIPLFFFLSGLFFDPEKFSSYGGFVRRRMLQLLIPYFAFNIITYLLWLFAGRYTGEDVAMGIPVLEPFWGVFYGNTNGFFLHHNVPLWFLACLFMTEVLFFPVIKFLNKKHTLLFTGLMLITGYFTSSEFLMPLPWGLNIVSVTIFFYAGGYLLKKPVFAKHDLTTVIILLVISGLSVYFIAGLNGKIEVSDAVYGNYIYFLPGAVAGIVFMISFSKLIERLSPDLGLLLFTGRNTLIIFALHLTAGSFVKAISFYIFKLPLSIYHETAVCIAYSLFSLLLLLPVAFFIQQYLPLLAGKPVQRK